MAAEDAVLTAALARDEVRKSLARMEYHLARGPRGVLGVNREVAFLDAMGRQSARLGNTVATAATNVSAKPGLGLRAKSALTAQAGGNTASAGRLKSSLLSEYSQDTMNGAREWTYTGEQPWVWATNASACPACLHNHGSTFEGPFVPMHPSCLCFPLDPADAAEAGVEQLTDKQLTDTLLASNNRAFVQVGQKLADNTLTVGTAAREATRRSATGLARWSKTLKDQSARVAAAGEPATATATATVTAAPAAVEPVLEVPTLAEVKAAKEVVLKEIKWLDSMKEAGVDIRYSAARHEQILARAQNILNRSVTSAHFRGLMDDAMRTLNRFETLSDTNKGRQTKWAGRFKHRTSVRTKSFSFDDALPQSSPRTTFRAIELQMRYQNTAAMEEWNALVTAYNAELRIVNQEVSAARLAIRQAARAEGKILSSYEIDQLVDPALWRRVEALQKTKPKKGAVGLTADRPAQDVAEILLHEVTHAVDEATGFAYSEKVLADGIRDEFRRIEKAAADQFSSAFRYGAESGLGGGNGHETFAEVVRMYHHGTGIMTKDGIAKQSAVAWREAHPTLATWVEENVLR